MITNRLPSRWAALAVLSIVPALVAIGAEPGDGLATNAAANTSAKLPHPHFAKALNCKIQKGLEIGIRHLTVTFDKDGAEKMPVGGAWHLAGATFETTGDLIVGGQKIKAGSYALSAQKAVKGWQLTLHEGQGFSRPSEKAPATVLKTDFKDGTLMFEHLNCDIQPGGDKKSTKLFLDVRFDKMLARVLIEIPE